MIVPKKSSSTNNGAVDKKKLNYTDEILEQSVVFFSVLRLSIRSLRDYERCRATLAYVIGALGVGMCFYFIFYFLVPFRRWPGGPRVFEARVPLGEGPESTRSFR